ncbi:MAG: TrmB family transcriptional regulator [Candidatus Hodarchaeota archaeon]
MEDKNAHNLLKSFNFTDYEARAYLNLTSSIKLTAEELSIKTAIPLTRIYSTLKSLTQKGFVKTNMGRPKTYEASPPETAIPSYVEYQKANLKKGLYKMKENGEELLHELEPRYWESRYKISPEELLRPLTDLKSAENETINLIAESEKNVYILSAVFGWSSRIKDEIRRALERGVSFSLLLISPEADKKGIKNSFSSLRFKVKVGTDFWYPMRETIVDKRKAVFVIWASTDKETFWNPIIHKPHLTSHPAIVKAFSDIFEHMWEKAT